MSSTKTASRSSATRSAGPTRRKSSAFSGPVGSRKSVIVIAIVPAIALIALFVGAPLVQGVWVSLSNWKGVGPVNFTGFGNYVNVFADNSFFSSLLLTGWYAVLSTIGIVIVAAALAAAVSAGVKGAVFYRVVWFIPGIAPMAAVGIFWSIAFQPGTGVVNVILGALGLGSDHAWLAEADSAIYPVILVTIWASSGFAFLILLGAMEQIPVSVYEAARLDGGGSFRVFFSITLPLIRPVLAVIAILELIWHFNGFTVIWAMTQGGPGFATSILPVLIYRQAFEFTDFGPASAMAIIGGVILIVIGAIGVRLSRSKQGEK